MRNLATLLVFLVLFVGMAFLPSPRFATAQCVPPECYPTETPYPEESDGVAPEAWGGYSDGRLNPHPAEYYSLWCNYDRLDIYRALPDTELLKLVPLADIISLRVGGELDLGDFMTLVRQGEDTLTVYGSNGNRAPEPGEKEFSLAECIDRNGGVPEPPPPPPPEPDSGSPEIVPTQDPEEQIQDCYALHSDDAELLLDCFASVGSQGELPSVYYIFLYIFQLCAGLPVGMVLAPSAFLLIFRRRRRKR